MKTNILATILTLFLSVGMVGCDDKKDTPPKEHSDCETDRPIYETLENEPATIQYGNYFRQEKTFVILPENPNKVFPLYPCGNSLPKEYQIEGLKVKVSGECRNCTPNINDPAVKIAPLFKINITSIQKLK